MIKDRPDEQQGEALVRPLFGPAGAGPGRDAGGAALSRSPQPPAPVLRWPRPPHLGPRRLFDSPEDKEQRRREHVKSQVEGPGPETDNEGEGPDARNVGAGDGQPGAKGLLQAEAPPAPAPSPAEVALAEALKQAEAATAAFQSAHKQAEEERQRYVKALGEVMRLRDTELSTLETELLDLSMEVARELFLQELKTDRRYVVRLVEAALRVVTDEEAATVLVAPEDHELLERERERLSAARGGALIRVSVDATLHGGECMVQVGRARVDARLHDRLERVRKALRNVDTETE